MIGGKYDRHRRGLGMDLFLNIYIITETCYKILLLYLRKGSHVSEIRIIVEHNERHDINVLKRFKKLPTLDKLNTHCRIMGGKICVLDDFRCALNMVNNK